MGLTMKVALLCALVAMVAAKPPPTGEDVQVQEVCKNGKMPVNCIRYPCDGLETCPAHPTATCSADYCVGCAAIWTMPKKGPKKGSVVTKTCHDVNQCPSGQQKLSGHLNCGRGGQPCPSGYKCEIATNDAYAVCCRLVCPPVQPNTFGICVEACGDDKCKSKNQVCCSNGCGHVCMDPLKPGHTHDHGCGSNGCGNGAGKIVIGGVRMTIDGITTGNDCGDGGCGDD